MKFKVKIKYFEFSTRWNQAEIVISIRLEAISINKGGYTANTSRGRVGRGRNARFHTFKLDHHGPTNQPTDGRTDKASYRVASPRLKKCS